MEDGFDDEDGFDALHATDMMDGIEERGFREMAWRGISKVAKAIAPIAKTFAPFAGKAIGTALGYPTGTAIGGAPGSAVGNLEDGDGLDAGDGFDSTQVGGMEAAAAGAVLPKRIAAPRMAGGAMARRLASPRGAARCARHPAHAGP